MKYITKHFKVWFAKMEIIEEKTTISAIFLAFLVTLILLTGVIVKQIEVRRIICVLILFIEIVHILCEKYIKQRIDKILADLDNKLNEVDIENGEK